MPSYFKIENFTEKDDSFPVNPIVQAAIHSFMYEAKCTSIPYPSFIKPAVDLELKRLQAKEFYVSFSNKVRPRPNETLCIHYKT